MFIECEIFRSLKLFRLLLKHELPYAATLAAALDEVPVLKDLMSAGYLRYSNGNPKAIAYHLGRKEILKVVVSQALEKVGVVGFKFGEISAACSTCCFVITLFSLAYPFPSSPMRSPPRAQAHYRSRCMASENRLAA